LKKQRYRKNRFDLSECKVEINIVQNSNDKDFGTAFLNVTLPDGRWIPFRAAEESRVPLLKNDDYQKMALEAE
jgi:hypothetical protein